MAEQTERAAAPAAADTGADPRADDALWQESYRQACEFARDINDDLSRLVTNLLIFNGLLLAALALLFGRDLGGPFLQLIPDLLFAVAVFGVLFNGGAVFSWTDAYRQWLDVRHAIAVAEAVRPGRLIPLQAAIGAASTGMGRVTRFSPLFFALFALFWLGFALWLWYWLRGAIFILNIFG